MNAGADTRIDPFGLICTLRRRYSYKSTNESKLHTHGAWPWGSHPFLLSLQLELGQWQVASRTRGLEIRPELARLCLPGRSMERDS